LSTYNTHTWSAAKPVIKRAHILLISLQLQSIEYNPRFDTLPSAVCRLPTLLDVTGAPPNDSNDNGGIHKGVDP